MIRLINVLARRSRVIYLDRRPHRATLILSNIIGPIKILFRDRPIIVRRIAGKVVHMLRKEFSVELTPRNIIKALHTSSMLYI